MTERFQLLHKTTYDFAEWVPRCELEAQLRPRPQAGLTCLSHLVAVIALPQRRETASDQFGNPVETMVIRRPLRRLIVSATTTLDLTAETRLPSPGANGVPEPSLRSAESALTPDDVAREACFEYAAPALTRAASCLDGIAAFARQINRDMTYDERVVDVGRSIAELLRERRGICQDYARLAVAALRTHRIASRWVVGYVLPGTQRNPSSHGAYRWLHAWFSAFVPDRGWMDFDATEPSGEANDLLTLAWGSDEATVGPLRGKLAVEVSRQKVAVDIVIDRLA
jgi:transglutaminase-like putative cysteine protease